MPQTALQGELAISYGGAQSSLNITAAAVVKATAGRLFKIVVIAPGTTSGSLTINDASTTGAASATNTIFSALYSALTAGQVINLDWPCANGITISAVPGAGSPIFAVSYY